jgi:hypothetical protein
MFKIILKGKFRERKMHLSTIVKVMYYQPFTGSIQQEHIRWWKKYWIKPIMLEILYPKKGWITLVKIFREGKPSIRVITTSTSSSKRELLVYKQLYGEEVENVRSIQKRQKKFRDSKKDSKESHCPSSMV